MRRFSVALGVIAVAGLFIGLPMARAALDPILAAARAGDLKAVQARLAAAPKSIKAKDFTGHTALHYAANSGHAQVAALLLAKGADPNALNMEGRSPLHLASMRCFPEVVKLLIAKGAKVNLKGTMFGSTPLHAAAGFGCVKVAEVLLDNKAKTDIKDKQGLTPLGVAQKDKMKAVLELFKKRGVTR
jgi:ankyrin repeat protein